MADHLFGAIELALVFGGAVAWGLWELRATRRARRESERREAAAATHGQRRRDAAQVTTAGAVQRGEPARRGMRNGSNACTQRARKRSSDRLSWNVGSDRPCHGVANNERA